MTGRLRTSFRSGNLAEELGILLLKGVAAVAGVPRQEDIGIDAVATLLRRDNDGNCYAEDTFVVQLKSESEAQIEYSDHAFKWFIRQTSPMFVGRVSLIESKIALYPTIFASQAISSLYARSIKIRFGDSDVPPMLREQLRCPWMGESSDVVVAWLGKPVAEWTVGDLTNRELLDRIYLALKRIVSELQRAIDCLSNGHLLVLDWSTNDADSIRVNTGIMKTPDVELREIAERCAPSLHGLMMKSLSLPKGQAGPILQSLTELASRLRMCGVEMDPGNHFGFTQIASQVMGRAADADD
jgi:hypothetical protein